MKGVVLCGLSGAIAILMGCSVVGDKVYGQPDRTISGRTPAEQVKAPPPTTADDEKAGGKGTPTPVPHEGMQLQKFWFKAPDGWLLKQEGMDQETEIYGFQTPNAYLLLYIVPGNGPDMKAMFVNGSTIVKDKADALFADRKWSIISTSKGTFRVSGF